MHAAIVEALGAWGQKRREAAQAFAKELTERLAGAYPRGIQRKRRERIARRIALTARNAAAAFENAIQAQRTLDADLEDAGQFSLKLRRKSGMRTRVIEQAVQVLETLQHQALDLSKRARNRPPAHVSREVARAIAGLYWVHFGELPGISRGAKGKHPTPYVRLCKRVEERLRAQGKKEVTLGRDSQADAQDYAQKLRDELRGEIAENGEVEDSPALRRRIFDADSARRIRDR